jgi:hypothetical protein
MSLEVKTVPHTIKQQTSYGEVEKQTGLDRVYVNGKHAGYMPTGEQDAFRGVFHPLSGFPRELCASVVDKCKSMKGHLEAPQPQEQVGGNEE